MPYQILENCIGCGHCVQWCPTRAIRGRRRVSYRIDGASCIDCGVCARICTFGAVLCPDGNIATPVKRSQWNRPHWDYQVCTQCNLCVPACPVKCIQIADRDDRESGLTSGFPYVSRPRMCIGCGFCEQACLDGAIQMKTVEFRDQTVVIN